MHLPPNLANKTARAAGFSLVEISLALAIVAIALVALASLLPTGLSNFREAMDAQTAGEIFQRVVADAQETDFDALLESAAEKGGPGAQYYRMPLRHFDNQGTEIKTANPDQPSQTEAQSILYTVRVRGSLPGDLDPKNHLATRMTSLPGPATARFNPRDLTFLTVQVVLSGGVKKLAPLVDADTFLISETLALKNSAQVRTYTAVVARNGYKN